MRRSPLATCMLCAVMALGLSTCVIVVEIGRDGGSSGLDMLHDATSFEAGTDTPNPTTDTINPRAAIKWARSIGAHTFDSVSAMDIHRRTDTLFVTGLFDGAVDFGGGALTSSQRDIFIASYGSDGRYGWAKALGTPGDDAGSALVVTPAGDLLITGHLGEGSVDFGGGKLEGGVQDVFVARFGSAAQHRWSRRWANTLHGTGNSGSSIALDGAGNVCVGGHHSGTINFGDGPLDSDFFNYFNPFVFLMDPAGDVRWSRGTTSNGGVFTGEAIATIGADGTVYLGGSSASSISFGRDTL
ncbi:MAG: hypothetical protein JRH20_29350, partial [Deltaproteobacteria bacterium]|nr:hypothetical protein [Deltaproteobacteria bacterium]